MECSAKPNELRTTACESLGAAIEDQLPYWGDAKTWDAKANNHNGKMIMLRVPYPMGFYAKGLDGRIGDAKAGWKGRGIWTTSGDRTPWLREGGKGSLPIAVQFQVRPDPLRGSVHARP